MNRMNVKGYAVISCRIRLPLTHLREMRSLEVTKEENGNGLLIPNRNPNRNQPPPLYYVVETPYGGEP